MIHFVDFRNTKIELEICKFKTESPATPQAYGELLSKIQSFEVGNFV